MYVTSKKVGKTTKPFRNELNQIPYDYTVEVTNRSVRVPEELWTKVHNIVREAVTKIIPKKKKYKEAKWLSEKALQIPEKEEKQKARKKEKDKPN